MTAPPRSTRLVHTMADVGTVIVFGLLLAAAINADTWPEARGDMTLALLFLLVVTGRQRRSQS